MTGVVLLVTGQAWAQTSTCTDEPSWVVPWLHDVVPPSVQPVVQLAQCGQGDFSLVHESGTPVTFALDSDGIPGFARIVPDAPLAPGEYSLAGPGFPDEGVRWFSVADGADLRSPHPPTLTVDFGEQCNDDFAVLVARVDVAFPDADPEERGLLIFHSTVDGVRVETRPPARHDGDPLVEFDVFLQGNHTLCVDVVLEDLTGAVVWESGEVCGPPPECAFEPPEEEEGCGCEGGGSGASGLAGVVVLALRRRRRAGVEAIGLEPTTPCLQSRSSAN